MRRLTQPLLHYRFPGVCTRLSKQTFPGNQRMSARNFCSRGVFFLEPEGHFWEICLACRAEDFGPFLGVCCSVDARGSPDKCIDLSLRQVLRREALGLGRASSQSQD